ncbi:RluA family pseudouridine synthase [Ponticaulis sp.]|uniref:RluA family pseudouridine synthase n=1 Tax=Ponticaulis sp. TaxID=2020902 RepID=UPI00261A4E87|nr:RluA family pseudouridine synthase [Ponticaulis sp.]MDF1680357.1 RluA family pseudouridine synthase [Ponticaulis sp.]
MKAPLDYRPPATDPLPVIHLDEAMIVVDKPSGLLSVPGRLPQHKDSMIGRLQAAYPDALTVHRLDMDTSGLMVFARGADVHRTLSKAFEAKTVIKRYVALVHGVISQDEGEVDLPILKDWPNRPKHMVHEDGKPSQTRWKVLERLDGKTLVELTPLTGRTHQLRIHMAELGHGILGDGWYGSPESMAGADRLCLHAAGLSFTHPATGEMCSFETDASFM